MFVSEYDCFVFMLNHYFFGNLIPKSEFYEANITFQLSIPD